MQGQLNFAYTPLTDSTFSLKKGNVYEVFDMAVSLPLLKKVPVSEKILDDFIERIQAGNATLLVHDPFWGNVKVLDTIEYFMRHPDKDHVAEEVVKQVIEAAATPKPLVRHIREDHLENLYQVKEDIKRNYRVHSPIDELAKKAHMNSTYFKSMFTEVFDLTPYQYLLYERLKIAKDLLREKTFLSFTEVAELSGFPSYDNFRRTFNAKEEKTISAWRNSPDFVSFLLVWQLLIEDLLP